MLPSINIGVLTFAFTSMWACFALVTNSLGEYKGALIVGVVFMYTSMNIGFLVYAYKMKEY